VDVRPIPGLEHLPFAEVWLHEADAEAWREACRLARALGKTGLEVWTTTRTPDVPAFLERLGYDEVRRYAISELDVLTAPEPEAPRYELVTLAERPELGAELFALAREGYADQPGRRETRIDDAWHAWGLRAHPPEAYFVALEHGRVLGYGYLAEEDGKWSHGFTTVRHDARGRGVAGAIKRAQIAWAKSSGVPALRTANEVRLTAMVELNRRLGYVPLYEEIVLRGPLAQDGS
jgi:GNAT superfamily N-acetyltransferase